MQGRIIPYNPNLRERASALRKNMTHGEALLWAKLSRKQMCGCDFDRQRPLDEYIVDFHSKELCLAIEIDGESHTLKGARDVARQRRLESLGVRFLRFTEREVVANLQSVADQIEMWIQQQMERKPLPKISEDRNGKRTDGNPPLPLQGGEQKG